MKGTLENISEALLLALRFGEMYWISSEAGQINLMRTNVYDLRSYSRQNGPFSDLGGGTVCLGAIFCFPPLQS